MMQASVLVRLEGGLGNQMFQFAAGRAIAVVTSRQLLVDAAAIARGPSNRRYELPLLQIQAAAASPLSRLAARAQVGFRSPPVLRALARAVSGRRWTLLRDPGCGCDERLFTTPGDLMLEGPWQSAAYVERSGSVAAAMRHEFSLRLPLTGTLAALAADIAACESVCVHVRRGDYALDPRIAAVHGTLPAEYYAAAAARIAAKVPGPMFFVFSDDLEWARANLEFPGPTRFIGDAAGMAPAVDQRLMASARHFIIANSSFSWWAAWLGTHPGKLVVAPQRWFRDAPAPAGLVPPDWIEV